VKILKYHALGNDYLFIDSAASERPAPDFVRRICHRNFGIGSDGILYGGVSHGNFEVTVINPDASIAETSGNGLRIFARAMLDCGNVSIGDEFRVDTHFREVLCKIVSGTDVAVDMGVPLFSAANLPTDTRFGHGIEVNGRKYVYHAVSMGNPHCVVFVDSLVHEHVLDDGPILEGNQRFPARTNVQFANVLGQNDINIEIWERGAGYTLASGSSSCGVFAVARRLGMCSKSARIHMPGGMLSLEEAGGGSIVQTGPVEMIAECVVVN
jgi:diaminopimelate epimerase